MRIGGGANATRSASAHGAGPKYWRTFAGLACGSVGGLLDRPLSMPCWLSSQLGRRWQRLWRTSRVSGRSLELELMPSIASAGLQKGARFRLLRAFRVTVVRRSAVLTR